MTQKQAFDLLKEDSIQRLEIEGHRAAPEYQIVCDLHNERVQSSKQHGYTYCVWTQFGGFTFKAEDRDSAIQESVIFRARCAALGIFFRRQTAND